MRYRWHQLVRTQKIQINGVFISTSPIDVKRRIRKALFNGTYESQERYYVEKYLKKDSRVLEIGCGIGLVSLVAHKICTDGLIKSYEANPHMEKVIKKNYALNGFVPNLEMKAVSNDGKDIEFHVDPEVISSSIYDRQRDFETLVIQSVALDTIIKNFSPDTIIMDVEGAEIELLEKSKLSGVTQMIVELHPHITGDKKICYLNDRLEAIGFTISAQKGNVCVYRR